MPRTFKYLNKELLDKINHTSQTIYHYNRTIPQRVIDALDPEKFVVVTFNMLHEHIAGKPADPHVRCIMQQSAQQPFEPMILDVPMDLYEALPTHTIEDKPTEEQPAAIVPQGV
jgi:hypothetical protein